MSRSAMLVVVLVFFCAAAKSEGDKILPCASAADCDDRDPCTIESCAPDGFCAWAEVFCPVSPRHAGNPCFYGKCTNSSSGTALCVTLDDICDDGDACTLDRCDRYTGECSYQQRNCRDSDFCTIDHCDRKLGCMHEQASCDDGDACTEDSCDPKFGCAHVRQSCSVSVYSPAYNACRISECDPASGRCVERDRDYPIQNSKCFATKCDPRRGWFDDPVCDVGRGEICHISSEDSEIICVPPYCQLGGDCGSEDYFCCSGKCARRASEFASECCGATDCPDPEYDMCCDGECIPDGECCGLSDCEPYGAICDLEIHECFSCMTHVDCENAYGPGKKCDAETRECRDPLCARDSDCLDGDACTADACIIEEGACVYELRPWECECHDSSDCEFSLGACFFCDRGLCRGIATCDDWNPSTEDYEDPETGECAHRLLRVDERPTACSLATFFSDGKLSEWESGWRAQVAELFLGGDVDARLVYDGLVPASTPLTCGEFQRHADGFGKKQNFRGRVQTVLNLGDDDETTIIVGICADGDPCTVDMCDGHGNCAHSPKNCYDGNMCTVDSCEPTNGTCLHTPLECPPLSRHYQRENCPVERWCFPGDGLCYPTPAMCEEEGNYPGPLACVPPTCDDGDPSTHDYCNEATGECANLPEICDDGLACTLDFYVAGVGCQSVSLACPLEPTSCMDISCSEPTGELTGVPRECLENLDNNSCSDEVCVPGSGCVSQFPGPYVDTAPCALDHTCGARTEECMEYHCLNTTTGEDEFAPRAAGTPCRTDDPCSRFACNGRGYCVQRADISTACPRALFQNPRSIVVLCMLIFATLVLVAAGITIGVVSRRERSRRKRL